MKDLKKNNESVLQIKQWNLTEPGVREAAFSAGTEKRSRCGWHRLYMKKIYEKPNLSLLEIVLDDVVLSSSGLPQISYDEDAQNDTNNGFDW